ncbi:hypothetical protein OA410_04245 [Paracoccaceae bacterium]|nr:hypothetical protein [Paracoccaceae bacterium]
MNSEIDRKIAVIFVADVVGYSKHMEKDENATIKSYNACETILKKLLKKYKGSVFNTAGDSVLAEFPSAVNAVECGVDFQNEIKKRNQSDKTDVKLEFRLGINMGDVVKKEDNLIGDGVNIAARLEALAQPNGITISKSVYDFVVPKTKMTFNDLGVQKVKQNEFHAFDILLDPSQKRQLNTKGKSRLVLLTSIAAVLIATFLTIILNLNFLKSDNSSVSDQELEYKVLGRTLLILPFENNSPNEFDYVAKGITDHLQSTLPPTILLNVVPRNESEQIKNNKNTIESLKNDFDISYVLSGRVSVINEKFRLSLELLDIHKNEILSSSNSEFQVNDLFAAQDQIEFNLRKEIQTKLTMGSVLSSKYQDNFKKREVYNEILMLRVEENSVQRTKTFLETENEYKNIYEENEANPMSAFFYARAIFKKVYFKRSNNIKDDILRLVDILNKAISINPQSSVLYAFRAFVKDSYFRFFTDDIKWSPRAIRDQNKLDVKKAILMEPENLDTLYWSSKFYANIGNAKMAAPLIEKVISLAPFGPHERKAFRCRVYLGAFDLLKAEEVANELIELSDKKSVFLGLMFRSYIEAKTKRLSAAKETFQQVLTQYNLTTNEAVSEFRKYTGEDTYYSSVMFNTFYSFYLQ